MQTYRINPEVPRGYVLNEARGAVGIIRPEATTNLCLNPSVETNLTGYSANGATIERVTTWQRRGAYGIKVTPLTNTGSRGVIYDATGLTNGQPLTISFDFLGIGGLTYAVVVTSGATTTTRFVATGLDQRIAVTLPTISGTTASIEIDLVSNGMQPFYVDGLQLEHKSYATTYCDGDCRGFVETQVDFAWTGTRHASTSTRSAQTRAGGRVIMLDSIGFKILSILGLGFAPIVPLAMPLATGGSAYQTTIPAPARDFSLVGDMYGTTPQDLLRQRDDLADLLNPYLTAVPQPLVLRHEAYDTCGLRPITRTVDLVCHYAGGLEGVWDNNHQERAGLKFRMFWPMLTRASDSGAALDVYQSLAQGRGIAQRAAGGGWSAMGTGAQGIEAIISRPGGGLYIGGTFATIGGVANTVRIARWDGNAYAALGTGAAGGNVYALATLADGTLIAGGSFTSVGGVANTAGVAKWTGSAWASIATSGANGPVYALAVGQDGTLYVAGDFTQINGQSITNIAAWNGVSWAEPSPGGDPNSSIYALAIATNGDVLAAGAFTLINGQAINRVARYSPAAATWTAIGDGFDDEVYAILQAPNGVIYAGGIFTVSGTTSINRIGQFGGTAWAPMTTGPDEDVQTLAYDPLRQLLYVGAGNGGGLESSGYSVWNGSGWLPSEILPLVSPATAIHVAPDGTLTVGGSWAAPLITAGSATVTNNGTAYAYPTIVVTSPTGPVRFTSLTNATTGAAIYLDTQLSTGEVVTITLRPDAISMVSSLRGSIIGDVLPGSNLTDWKLQPGANTVRAFAGADAIEAVIIWQDSYLDINQTVIRE